MDIRSDIKSILAKKAITLTQLAKIMSENTGKIYTVKSLSGKLARESLSYKEAILIADIIGCKLEFVDF